MKKMSNFAIFFALLLISPRMANAAATFSFDCDVEALDIGQSTQCTISGINDEIETSGGTTNGVTGIVAEVITEDGLVIDGFLTNDYWTNSSSMQSNTTKGNIVLQSKDQTNGVASINFDVGKITVRLTENTVDCGKICVGLQYTQNNQTATGINITNELVACEDFETTGTPEEPPSPETGAYASYAILAGGAILAVTTITIIKNKNKFYRV